VSLSLTASTPATASPPRQLPPHLGGSRGRAVQSLSRGVRDHEILLLLTGAAGAGKSVVLNATLAALTNEPILVIHLSHPDSLPWSQRELSARILGRPIAPRMASPADDTIAEAIEELAAASERSQVVIAVDDAQKLTDDALEFLLRLASPVRGSKVPPQLLLAGRGAFWERQLQSHLQVITRVAQVVTLEPLLGSDAQGYISSRLRLAGSSINDTTDEALAEILAYSAGFPERINTVVSTSLAIGVCRGSRVLSADIVEAAAASLASPPVSPDLPDGVTMVAAAAGGGPYPPGSEPREPDAVAAAPLDRYIVAGAIVSSKARPGQVGFSLADGTGNVDSASPPPPGGGGDGAPAAPRLHGVWPSADLTDAAAHGRSGAMTGSRLATISARVEPSLRDDAIQPGPSPRSAGSWRSRATAALILAIVMCLAVLPPRWSASVQDAVHAIWSRGPALLTQESTVRIRSLIASTVPPGGVLAATVTAIRMAVASVGGSDLARPVAQAKPSGETLEAGASDIGTAIVRGAAIARTDGATGETASGPMAVPATGYVAQSEVQSGAPRAEVTPLPKPGAQTPPSAEMVAVLLGLGDVMLRQGDILSARSVYERAASAGSARGATGVGKTYDPEFLATVTAPGPKSPDVKSDVTRAIEWYRLASTVRGDMEAGERLRALTVLTSP